MLVDMGIDIYKLPQKNRVVYSLILEKEHGNVSAFARNIGSSQQKINRLFHVDKRTGKYPDVLDDVIDAICDYYGIGRDDFVEGRYGSIEETMALRFSQNEEENGEGVFDFIRNRFNHPDISDFNGGKPFYDVPFQMGYQLPYNDNTTNPDYLIDFKPLNRCDFLCRATGDSMFPTICDGDIVAVKQIPDMSASIINRDIYAIELVNDLRAIKRLVDKGDSFVLVSDNKEYEDQTISKKDVRRIFRVIGSIKARLF